MTSDHTCRAVGCSIVVRPDVLMCVEHWAMVPRAVQNLIYHHYPAAGKEPSGEYIATAFVAISCVAVQQGKLPPRLDPERRPAQAELAASEYPD